MNKHGMDKPQTAMYYGPCHRIAEAVCLALTDDVEFTSSKDLLGDIARAENGGISCGQAALIAGQVFLHPERGGEFRRKW